MKKYYLAVCGVLIVSLFVFSFKNIIIARADIEPEPVSDLLPWGLFGENGIDIEDAWKIVDSAPDVTVGVAEI